MPSEYRTRASSAKLSSAAMATEWTERRDAKVLYSTANAPQNDLKWSSTVNDPQLGPQTKNKNDLDSSSRMIVSILLLLQLLLLNIL